MRKHAVAYLIYAQLCFFFFLTIAIFITTAGFQNNHGLSFYGEHWDTAVPFGAGFIFCDYFLLRAANVLPKSKPPFKTISKLINILTVLLLFILLTPDTLNSFFDWSHIVDSSILFAFELSFAGWLTFVWYRDNVIWLLLSLQFIAAILAMLSQFHVIYYLSEGILFSRCFSVYC